MLIAEYDYETDIRVQREEAAAEAWAEATKKSIEHNALLMHENGISDELICKITGLSFDFLAELYNRRT